MNTDAKNKHADIVDKLASQCVKCALCLPHCPTYELTKDENESPRGRIALFQALAQEKLPLTEKAKSHLDLCLGCRACERVCPAHVEYGQLLTLGRALLPELPQQSPLAKPPKSTRFFSWLLSQPKNTRRLQWLLWIIQSLGLRSIARHLKLTSLFGLSALDALLPSVARPLKLDSFYAAIGPKRGSVLLFTGCLGSLCSQDTLNASIVVLRHLGMDVHVPPQQTCCGAIATHAGNITEAHKLAKQNCDAFLPAKIDHIITTATGCNAVLQEYASHFSFSPDLADADFSQFSSKVVDIVSFIQQCEWPQTLKLSPIKKQIIVHTPCTRRNVLKTPQEPAQMLARIPELQINNFSSAHCCGAAGTYMLDHPSMAEDLAQQLLKELDNKEVNFIATSNIGCALHLRKQIKESHPHISIGHPVILLAQSLGK